MLTLADGLSCSRLAAVPCLGAAALAGAPRLFAAVLVAAVVTDALDGLVARRTRSTSERGAQLDSLADTVLLALAPLLAVWVYPALRSEALATAATIAVAIAIPPLAGALRWGRLPCYQSTLARVATAAVSLGLVGFVCLGWLRPMQWATALLVAAVIDEVAITCMLPFRVRPVANLFRAWRIAHDDIRARAALPALTPVP